MENATRIQQRCDDRTDCYHEGYPAFVGWKGASLTWSQRSHPRDNVIVFMNEIRSSTLAHLKTSHDEH